MASIMEFQDFKLNQHLFVDSSELQVLEDLLGGMELPTPPLSPDHTKTTDSSQLTETTQTDLDVGESILQQIASSAEDLLFDSQGTYGSDSSSDILDIDPSILGNPHALLQDCMWNCDAYEPRHSIGICTPAPSPPPKEKEIIMEEEEDEEQSFHGSKCKELGAGISPNEVLYMGNSETVMEEGKQQQQEEEEEEQEENVACNRMVERETSKPGLVYRRSISSISSAGSRLHLQATSSESEEEIDVVTISDRPEKLASRMNTRKRTTSLSAPCSRHVSPSHMPPAKKRKCHAKRTHRLSSVGSNYGDGLESDDEQRRASHNVLERKRRNDLKYSFQVLRGQIPELKENQRAPKVTILRKATEYIKHIRDEEEDMQSRMAKERRRESKLLQRLAYLKSLSVC